MVYALPILLRLEMLYFWMNAARSPHQMHAANGPSIGATQHETHQLLPAAYASQFSQAQYSAPPLSWPLVRRTIEREFRQPAEALETAVPSGDGLRLQRGRPILVVCPRGISRGGSRTRKDPLRVDPAASQVDRRHPG